MEKGNQNKTNEELRKKVKEQESAFGTKSPEADLYRAIVDLASKEQKIDFLKKNLGVEPFDSSNQ